MSPERNPRSMMPMPPSSATAMAISARVIVSMLAETIGRFRVRCSDRRLEISIAAGSRRSRTLYCGVKRRSSNVQPRTRSRSVLTRSAYRETRRWPRLGREKEEAGERGRGAHRGYFTQSPQRAEASAHYDKNEVSEAVGRATRGMDREALGFTSAVGIGWHL